MKKIVLFFVCILMLAACGTMPETPDVEGQHIEGSEASKLYVVFNGTKCAIGQPLSVLLGQFELLPGEENVLGRRPVNLYKNGSFAFQAVVVSPNVEQLEYVNVEDAVIKTISLDRRNLDVIGDISFAGGLTFESSPDGFVNVFGTHRTDGGYEVWEYDVVVTVRTLYEFMEEGSMWAYFSDETNTLHDITIAE